MSMTGTPTLASPWEYDLADKGPASVPDHGLPEREDHH